MDSTIKKETIVTITQPNYAPFRVVWVTDSFAKTPMQAALGAEEDMNNRHFRPYFSVIDSQGNITNIDLDNIIAEKKNG